MSGLLPGTYKVSGDPNYGAAHISEDGSVHLAAGRDGRWQWNGVAAAKIDDLSDNASLRRTNDASLTKRFKAVLTGTDFQWDLPVE
jgi:hypothetical protein